MLPVPRLTSAGDHRLAGLGGRPAAGCHSAPWGSSKPPGSLRTAGAGPEFGNRPGDPTFSRASSSRDEAQNDTVLAQDPWVGGSCRKPMDREEALGQDV